MLLNEWLVLGTLGPTLSSFFSMLIKDAVLAISAPDAVGGAAALVPSKNDVFGGLVSHLLVFCISVTNLLPHEHLTSKSNKITFELI